MLDKLTAIEAKYSQIEARLAAPETYDDPAQVAKLNKEQSELQPLVETFRTYRRTLEARDQARELMSDSEMKELAQEEYSQAMEDIPKLERELQILLLPKDPNDDKNVIVEIRAGVGGEEAALFAHADVRLNPADIEMQVFRSSGAGGQHVNKTSSAVRLIHKPTGTVVECQQERSQFQNRDKAMRILASRLYEAEQEKISSEYTAQRRSQVGSGMRNERIRTYNFPQGRVTDHRIGLTLYKIDSVMDGGLDELIDALAAADQAEKLKQQE